MSIHLTTPHGQLVENPTEQAVALTLEELLRGGNPDADLWLEDSAGWAISVVPSGDVFFENVHEDSYQTLGPMPRESIQALLNLFIAGKIDEIRNQPWELGE